LFPSPTRWPHEWPAHVIYYHVLNTFINPRASVSSFKNFILPSSFSISVQERRHWTFWPLKMSPLFCFETQGSYYIQAMPYDGRTDSSATPLRTAQNCNIYRAWYERCFCARKYIWFCSHVPLLNLLTHERNEFKDSGISCTICCFQVWIRFQCFYAILLAKYCLVL
jgi:hypothetical protein